MQRTRTKHALLGRRVFGERFRAFFAGIGSVLDLSGNAAPVLRSRKSDSEALRGDWEAVAGDLRQAEAFGKEQVEEERSKQMELAL